MRRRGTRAVGARIPAQRRLAQRRFAQPQTQPQPPPQPQPQTQAPPQPRVAQRRPLPETDVADPSARSSGFDPFNVIPIFPGPVRRLHSAWLVLPCAVVAASVVAVTAYEGTLGTFADLRPAADVRYVFSETVRRTEPDFPLLRDVASFMLFLVIAAGVVLLHRQWWAIRRGLPELRRNGVVTPLRRPRGGLLFRLMRLHSLVRGCGEYGALDRVDQRMGRVTWRTRLGLSVGVLGVAFVLAYLARSGLDRDGFQVLAPTGVSDAERAAWIEQARRSWWAGPDHPAGQLVYLLIAWFAVALVLTCNVIGLASVYLAASLAFVAEFDADWYNRDGRYGWAPAARVCRTLYYCLVLLGFGISVEIALLGPQLAFSLVGLIALYVLMIPVWTVVPWLVFHKVEQRARDRRMELLSAAIEKVEPDDFERAQHLVAEVDRVRSARINPMRLPKLPLGAFASVVLLPIVLTALQIYAEIGLGRGS